jgi:hypothetical protein
METHDGGGPRRRRPTKGRDETHDGREETHKGQQRDPRWRRRNPQRAATANSKSRTKSQIGQKQKKKKKKKKEISYSQRRSTLPATRGQRNPETGRESRTRREDQ